MKKNNKENIEEVSEITQKNEDQPKQKEKKNKSKIKLIIACVLFIIVIISSALGGYYIKEHNKNKEEEKNKAQELSKEKEKALIDGITKNYAEIVYTVNEADLYTKAKDKYEASGKIGKDVKVTLEKIEKITKDNEYLKVTNLDGEYYINYKDIMKNEERKDSTKQTGMGSLSLRYKNYIPFNENVVTKETYSLYDTNDNFLYQLKGSIDKPIYIKKSDKYYIEYQDKLVYVKKDDVEKTKEASNTAETPASEMPVLLYHFFYNENNPEEVSGCNQIICLSESTFASHLDYMKNNGFFTPNMDEFEMFIDGELRLRDNTVFITIDDGWYASGGVNKLTEYGLNGSIFLITAAYDPQWVITDYVEPHSHSDNMHQNWQCPQGLSAIGGASQGGAILCWSEQDVLNDLKASRGKVNNSRAFCFPFFDYNDRAIDLVKQAGFTMGFIGGMRKASVGQDKMLIPRYSILSSTSVGEIASYIN